MEAKVVYERQDSFDMKSGPFGYERVGFAIGDRVFWCGCAGSGMPGGTYDDDKALAEQIVARWRAGDKSACYVCAQPILEDEPASLAHDYCAHPLDLPARTAKAGIVHTLQAAHQQLVEAAGEDRTEWTQYDRAISDAIRKAVNYLEGRHSWV